MASGRFDIKAELSGNSLIRLQNLERKLEDFEPLDIAARLIKDILQKRFLQTLDPDGNVWEVSRAAIKRKSKGKPGKTLFDTGRLFRSIVIHDIRDDSVKVGVPSSDTRNTRIGETHQVTGFRGTIRRFIGINDEDVAIVKKELEERLKRVVGNG